ANGDAGGDRTNVRVVRHLNKPAAVIGLADVRGHFTSFVIANHVKRERAALLAKMAIREVIHRVTVRADLLVDLEAALHGSHVVRPDRTQERERILFWLFAVNGGESHANSGDDQRRGGGKCAQHYDAPCASPPVTGLAMVSGTRSGRSRRPRIGRITRKKRK